MSKSDGINEGEVPQYYVEDSHPAIIRPEEWEAVQAEITRRKSKGRRHDCGSPFSGKILCGDCGSVYGSKVWHSNDKYRRVIWQCNNKFKNETKCATPHVDETILKERFLRVLSQYMADPEECIEGLRYVQKSMTDTDFIDADIEKAEQDLERLSAMVRSCILMNASANLTEEAYTQQYTDLTRQYEEKKAEYEALLERKKAMEATAGGFQRHSVPTDGIGGNSDRLR